MQKISLLFTTFVFTMVISFVVPTSNVFYADSASSTVESVIPLSLHGSGSISDPYLIDNEKDLKEFSEFVNSGGATSGKYFKVHMQNYHLHIFELERISSIGTSLYPFKGTFDGNGVTIDGALPTNLSDNYCGLFGKTVGARIKNITMSCNYKEVSCMYSGSLIAYAQDTTIDNCHNKTYYYNNNERSTYVYVGGLIGFAENSSIGKSSNFASVRGYLRKDTTVTYLYVGGLLGYGSNINISACKVMSLNSTSLTITATSPTEESHRHKTYCGGLIGEYYVGYAGNITTKTKTLSSSFCMGAIIQGNGQASYVGGIAGYAGEYCVIENCFNRSNVTANNNKAANTSNESRIFKENEVFADEKIIMPSVEKNSKNTINTTKIQNNVNAYAGGIVGYSEGRIESCYNTGNVIGGCKEIKVEALITFWELYSGYSTKGNYYSDYTKATCSYIVSSNYSEINGYTSCSSKNCYSERYINYVNIDVKEYYENLYYVASSSNPVEIKSYGQLYSRTLSNQRYDTYNVNLYGDGLVKVNFDYCKISFILTNSSCKINLSLQARWEDDKGKSKTESKTYDLYSNNSLNINQNYTTSTLKNSVPSGFDTSVWAVSSYINDGYPHLKQFYWQDQI